MLKQTKAIIYLSALILGFNLSVENANAQEGAQSVAIASDQVKLNIVLKPIQTILVNSSHDIVNFEYSSTNIYKSGVTKELGNHLSIFSTGGFEVSVKSDNESFKRVGGNTSLALSDMKIVASNGSKTNSSESYKTVTLSTATVNLIESTKGGRDLQYNVTYNNSAGGNDKYLNEYKYIATANTGKEAIFTTDITYTIIAK